MRFLLALILFLFFSCYQATTNCNAYKTGKFYSKVTINGKTYTSNFIRTNTLQVEHYNDKTDSAKVRWINNCEMVFKTINPKSRAERKDVHVKILTTTDSSYTFEYSYVGEVKKQTGIAYKVD